MSWNDGAIAAHIEHGSKVPSVQTAVHIYPIDGAVQRVGATDTAFANRNVKFSPVIADNGWTPRKNEANIAWVKDYAAALRPYLAPGGYINFMDGSDCPWGRGERTRVDDPRLQEVKAKYDPQNLFHVNQNIKPA